MKKAPFPFKNAFGVATLALIISVFFGALAVISTITSGAPNLAKIIVDVVLVGTIITLFGFTYGFVIDLADSLKN